MKAVLIAALLAAAPAAYGALAFFAFGMWKPARRRGPG